MNILTRASTFGPAVLPRNASNNALRPIMPPNARWYTIHHTGQGDDGHTNWMDLGDTAAELRSIQNSAQNNGKPWEYNYVVDSAGDIWEYAGDRVAAHHVGKTPATKNVDYNSHAIGVLLLGNFMNAKPTDVMIQAVIGLRMILLAQGRLSPTHEMLQHRQMPGSQTACPGTHVIERWSDFIKLPPDAPSPVIELPPPVPISVPLPVEPAPTPGDRWIGPAFVSTDSQLILTSPNYLHQWCFQGDGNAVQYVKATRKVVWQSKTGGHPHAALVLANGNMHIEDNGVVLWMASKRTVPNGSFLIVQDDGNTVLQDPQGNALWSTATGPL